MQTTDVTFRIIVSLVHDSIVLALLHKMTFGNITAKPGNWDSDSESENATSVIQEVEFCVESC